LISIRAINLNGEPRSKGWYKASLNGNSQVIKIEEMYGEDNVRAENLYEYDNVGRLIRDEHIDYNSDESSSFITYKYNEEGNIIERIICNKDMNKCDKSKYNYDSNDAMIELIWMDQKDSVFSHVEIRNDQFGNMIYRKDLYYPKNIKTYKYIYDKHNNWTKQIEFENGVKSSVGLRKLEYY